MIFGGSNQAGTVDAETEFWDGSSWTEVADLSTARNYEDALVQQMQMQFMLEVVLIQQ